VSPAPPYEEKTILLRVADGDQPAFAQLFHHWQGFLYTHIHRITENTVLTEEIVQDVFLKIWMSRETLREIDNFKVYLIVVSRNHAINALRKILREQQAASDFIQHVHTDDNDAVTNIQYSLIDEAIDQLSPRQKEVYLLHRHQRLTYAEIAERLGIGRDTVKEYLHIAVQSITRHVRGRLVVMLLLLVLER
jgi:RNA polymerase sigma-70 factor (ECF subfamily)